MKRKTKKVELPFSVSDLSKLEQHYKVIAYLNSNDNTKVSYLAFGVFEVLKHSKDVFNELEILLGNKDWIFGYFSYDLKNEVEPALSSSNQDFIQLDNAHFFIPKIVLEFNLGDTLVHYVDEKDVVEFYTVLKEVELELKSSEVELKQRVSKEEYINNVNRIRNHLKLGDIYEMNYCHEFYSENAIINPSDVYQKLNNLTNAPLSSYYKNNNQFILSGSPERFLKREGSTIISQPIKGTAKRGQDKKEDDNIKEKLANDPKERSENIMIVDLVRNDLSKTAAKGSVKVEELCKVYTFDTVHQMISTVTSQLKKEYSTIDVIKDTFPMGSMTGAPKIRAMQLIEQLESTKRGVYSGALGYIKPNGDFDFNVLIRTILYNNVLKRVSFMVGGAITLKSTAEDEYVETQLKAKALKQALQNEA